MRRDKEGFEDGRFSLFGNPVGQGSNHDNKEGIHVVESIGFLS
jgi:hypothetical protein